VTAVPVLSLTTNYDEEENQRLRIEIAVLKEREMAQKAEIRSKQDLVDVCQSLIKNLEQENKRLQEENAVLKERDVAHEHKIDQLQDEIVSLKLSQTQNNSLASIGEDIQRLKDELAMHRSNWNENESKKAMKGVAS